MNNLKDVSVEIPKRRLTVFTGISGSGKSSLVFDTIAAESQRLINETYSAFVQGFMPTLARPDVDLLEGLTTAIIVDQERMGANVRSTVGTATDANAMLRILFSRLGKPHIGSPNAYSFNVPSVTASGGMTVERGPGKTKTEKVTFNRLGGMCPRCEGMGTVTDFDLSALYDDSKSLNEGALTIPGYSMDGWYRRIFRESGFFDPDKPIRKFNKKELHDLLYKEPTRIKVQAINLTYEGLIPRIQKSYLSKDVEAMQPHIRAFVERAVTFQTCPECDGTRLSKEARSSKIKGKNIADVCSMQISDLADWVRGLDEPSVAPLVAGLQHLLDSFAEIGLGYLSLDRPSGTLSGRRSAAHQDDPPPRLVAHRRHLRLRRAHDRPAPPRHRADERPPAAAAGQGQHGARRGAQAGDDRDRRPRRRPRSRRRYGGRQRVFRGHRRGVAGQRHHHRPPSRRPGCPQEDGADAQRHAEGPRREDAQPAQRRRRHPARGAGGGDRRGRVGKKLADPGLGVGPGRRGVDRPGRDRRLATKQPGNLHRTARPDPRGVREGQRREAGAVQRQLRGRLPHLQRRRRHLHRPGDDGRRRHHMRGLRGEAVPGIGAGLPSRRPRHQRGARDAGDRGQEFFGAGKARTPAAHAILDRLADVGLGYLSLGQPLTTLSGGERQRLKLATHMAEKGGVYILDEPTTGLHLADVEQLLGLLDRLVDSGKSVIVIEHHQAVMAHADWIIDLGPGAGHDGGRIVFEGTPAALVAARSTLTGEHLAAYVGA